ncbi:MAG TPA: DUF4369 domain-containing protein, partial [Chitinophagaceae bacterium]|nr:DUF4369 domain-containing protein [Chitinophagaceae bacterium]
MRVFVILLLGLPTIVFGQREKFEINGTVEGLPTGSLVFLTDANNPTDTLSKDISKDGKFRLSGKVKEPSLYYLNFSKMKKDLLFVGNDELKISGN